MTKKTKSQPQEKPWSVLIAEDDLKSRAQLVKALHHRARCTTVENGEEAISAYRKSLKKRKPFDFVLLDVTMPNVNGFEVLKTIRAAEEDEKNASLKPTCVIMTTAYRDSLMEHYNMGWDEFITKPVDVKALAGKMQQLMNRRSL